MKNPKSKPKVPAGALCLVQPEQFASLQFSGEGENRKAKLEMTVYSGGVVRNHWYWGDVVLDLQGVMFTKKKYPILEGHDRSKKIAFHDGPLLTDDGSIRVNPDKVTFVSTEESSEFQRLSGEGFPYEASIRFNPKAIERLEKDVVGEANGIKIKGPGAIIRKFEFVEGSVCVFGYDRNTQSKAFSEEVELDCEFSGGEDSRGHNTNIGEEHKTMKFTKETLFAEQPDLVKEIQEDAVKAAAKTGTQFEDQLNDLTAKVATFQATVEKQAVTITELTNKNLALEKKDTLRTEAEFQGKADGIWEVSLSKSEIPERLHAKVKKHVRHTDFTDESGAYDWTKFEAAVVAEVKDWEAQIPKGSSVQGGGYQKRTPESFSEEETALEAEDEAYVKEMLELSGEKISEGGK